MEMHEWCYYVMVKLLFYYYLIIEGKKKLGWVMIIKVIFCSQWFEYEYKPWNMVLIVSGADANKF